MEVDKTLLLKLRKETLAPFSACSEALKSTNNNYQEAKKALFSKSILKVKSDLNSSSSENELPEGSIFSLNSDDYSIGIMFILRAQTDFVTNSKGFKDAQKEIGEVLIKYLKNSSSTQLSIGEALQLKDNKDNLTLENKILSLSSITKEKIQLSQLWISPKDNLNITLAYQHHNSKLGAILTLKKSNVPSTIDYSELKKLVLHYAATDNTFLTESEVTPEWLDVEKQKLRDSLVSKNPNIPSIENIVEKQIKKIVSDQTFSDQTFILDPSIKISGILSKYGVTPIWAIKTSL